MNIKLIGDKLLVEVDETETKTDSGLIVAKAEEQGGIKMGTVIAVGMGIYRDQGKTTYVMESKIGDKVMFHYGLPVLLEGKKYMVVSENDEVIMILG